MFGLSDRLEVHLEHVRTTTVSVDLRWRALIGCDECV